MWNKKKYCQCILYMKSWRIRWNVDDKWRSHPPLIFYGCGRCERDFSTYSPSSPPPPPSTKTIFDWVKRKKVWHLRIKLCLCQKILILLMHCPLVLYTMAFGLGQGLAPILPNKIGDPTLPCLWYAHMHNLWSRPKKKN